jgi:hypothetical protein
VWVAVARARGWGKREDGDGGRDLGIFFFQFFKEGNISAGTSHEI